MGERFGLPVAVENDANAAALAEWRLGAGRGADELVMLTLGTGVGGGVVLDGALYRGWAELGHMVVVDDGPPCQGTCTGRGHLEAFCSGQRRRPRRRAALGRGRDRRALVDRAAEGDAEALEALAEIGTCSGAAIGSLVNIFDPELVVIGGGFGIAAAELPLPRGARGGAPRGAARPARVSLRIVTPSSAGRGPDRRRAARVRGAASRASRAARGLRDADREPRRRHAARARASSRGRPRALRGHAAHARPARPARDRARGSSATTSTTRRSATRSCCRGSWPASGSRSSRTRACRGSTTRARGWSRGARGGRAGDGAARRRRRSRRRSSRAGSSGERYQFLGYLPRGGKALAALWAELARGRIPPSRSSRRSGCRRRCGRSRPRCPSGRSPCAAS